jgi:hypothetical protein
MNFKPTLLKIILSIVISIILYLLNIQRECMGGFCLDIKSIIDYPDYHNILISIICFLIIYIIWSLSQSKKIKKARQKIG